MDHPVWRPVTYTGRATTEAELHYGKVDGGSLQVLTGILSNKMYLYGTKFTVVVDHLHVVPMYKSHSKALPAPGWQNKVQVQGI